VKVKGFKDVVATKNAGEFLEEVNEKIDAFNRFIRCL
jgi:hypothetical protein